MGAAVKAKRAQAGAIGLQGGISAGTFWLCLIRVLKDDAIVSLFRLAAALGFATLAVPALGAQVNGHASYVVALGGINIANVNVDLTDDGSRYSLDLKANVAGLGAVVASGTASVTASGQSTSPLTSQQFDLQTKADGETFTVDVTYAGHDVSAFRVDPPLIDNYNRVPIERSHLTNVGDVLSAFVIKSGTLDKSLCRRKLQIFTGVERFNIVMAFAAEDEATSPRTGYQGPVILCNMDYQPISGHFTTSEMTNYLADSDRILIWYAPMGDTGYFIPYRVLLTTSMGDLSMVLTGMNS
jgi:uncharacterized protein DUF3108